MLKPPVTLSRKDDTHDSFELQIKLTPTSFPVPPRVLQVFPVATAPENAHIRLVCSYTIARQFYGMEAISDTFNFKVPLTRNPPNLRPKSLHAKIPKRIIEWQSLRHAADAVESNTSRQGMEDARLIRFQAKIYHPQAPATGRERDGIVVLALLDTGATANFISREFIERLGLARLTGPTRGTVMSAGGAVDTYGEYAVGLRLTDSSDRTEDMIYVFTTIERQYMGPDDVVLGMPWLAKENPRVDFRSHDWHFSNHRTDAAGTSMIQHNNASHLPERV